MNTISHCIMPWYVNFYSKIIFYYNLRIIYITYHNTNMVRANIEHLHNLELMVYNIGCIGFYNNARWVNFSMCLQIQVCLLSKIGIEGRPFIMLINKHKYHFWNFSNNIFDEFEMDGKINFFLWEEVLKIRSTVY